MLKIQVWHLSVRHAWYHFLLSTTPRFSSAASGILVLLQVSLVTLAALCLANKELTSAFELAAPLAGGSAWREWRNQVSVTGGDAGAIFSSPAGAYFMRAGGRDTCDHLVVVVLDYDPTFPPSHPPTLPMPLPRILILVVFHGAYNVNSCSRLTLLRNACTFPAFTVTVNGDIEKSVRAGIWF